MKEYILDNVTIPGDTEFLYNSMTSDDQYLYSTKLHFFSIQKFEHWLTSRLKNDFHDFFIVRESATRTIIGYVHNYDFSLVDGHCKLVVYIRPEYRKTGIGAFAAIMFIKKLFAMYPLRKLYSTIYDYNHESFKSNLAAGFVEEGVLKDFRYYNGITHCIHYLSLSRQQFENNIGKWVK